MSAGYLKVASPIERGSCKVAIPNHEIAQVFAEKIGLAYCKNRVEICR